MSDANVAASRETLQWLSRRRVPLGFAFGIAALVLARPTWSSLVAGGGIAALGEALRIWAAGHLQKGERLTVTGPYRWYRHPLYVGSALMAMGLSAAAADLTVAAIAGLYVVVMLSAAARYEDAGLRERFGVDYDEYRQGLRGSDSTRFRWEQVRRNREHRALLGLVGVFAMLALKVWWSNA